MRKRGEKGFKNGIKQRSRRYKKKMEEKLLLGRSRRIRGENKKEK